MLRPKNKIKNFWRSRVHLMAVSDAMSIKSQRMTSTLIKLNVAAGSGVKKLTRASFFDPLRSCRRRSGTATASINYRRESRSGCQSRSETSKLLKQIWDEVVELDLRRWLKMAAMTKEQSRRKQEASLKAVQLKFFKDGAAMQSKTKNGLVDDDQN